MIKKIFVTICILGIIGICTVLGINSYVKNFSKDHILSLDDVAGLEDVDCILVLGCSVKADGTPCDMLSDRIQRGVELYEKGVSGRVLMSGDYREGEYEEVLTMKRVAVERGVPSECIFLDPAGYSTYDSMVRAAKIFSAKKIVVVTQKYHLYRAIYIAEKFGVEAYGVDSDYRKYFGQTFCDVREILARCKDLAKVAIKAEPECLGEQISLDGNGDEAK